MIQSRIFKLEEVANKERKFGSQLSYYPCVVQDINGNMSNALFTRAQIKEAQARANRNPEDMPKEAEKKSFWDWLIE